MESRERLFAFMAEYEVICRKYEYLISACGCCDSPWPVGWDSEDRFEKNLKHLWQESEFPSDSPFTTKGEEVG